MVGSGVHHLVDVDHSPARGTGDDPVALEEVAGLDALACM